MNSRLVTLFVGALTAPLLGLGPADTNPPSMPEAARIVAPSSDPVEIGTFHVADGARRSGHHGAIDDLRSAPSCATQCITSGIAYAHPDGAELVVTTDVPATIWILVTVGDQTLHSMSTFGETSFSNVFELEPGTYHAMAAAQDANGDTSHAWGTFVVS